MEWYNALIAVLALVVIIGLLLLWNKYKTKYYLLSYNADPSDRLNRYYQVRIKTVSGLGIKKTVEDTWVIPQNSTKRLEYFSAWNTLIKNKVAF